MKALLSRLGVGAGVVWEHLRVVAVRVEDVGRWPARALHAVTASHATRQRPAPAPAPVPTAPPAYITPAASSTLYTHLPHAHAPRNPNALHAAERAATAQRGWLAALNENLSVRITKATGTMWCAYVFTGIGIGGLAGALTGNVGLALIFGAISSYLLQLVMLPVIQNGSGVLSRHAEIQAEEMYRNSVRILHDLSQTMNHLSAQDATLVQHSDQLLQQGKDTAVLLEQVSNLTTGLSSILTAMTQQHQDQVLVTAEAVRQTMIPGPHPQAVAGVVPGASDSQPNTSGQLPSAPAPAAALAATGAPVRKPRSAKKAVGA